jgi:hypothetical protein
MIKKVTITLLLLILTAIITSIGIVSAELETNLNINTNCSLPKDLIATGFNVNGTIAILNYDELGLCDKDDYFTTFYYSADNGKTFIPGRQVRQIKRFIEGNNLDFNGFGPIDFAKMLYYKLTFKKVTIKAKMNFLDIKNEPSSNRVCAKDDECGIENGYAKNEVCINGRCINMANIKIDEINENNNCIQQTFKISLLKRMLIPDSPAISCS